MELKVRAWMERDFEKGLEQIIQKLLKALEHVRNTIDITARKIQYFLVNVQFTFGLCNTLIKLLYINKNKINNNVSYSLTPQFHPVGTRVVK